MDYLNAVLSSVKGDNLEVRNDDEASDRLNYRWTVILLLMFSVTVTAGTYLNTERINCWVPAHFQGAWASYVNDYCWIRNTYYLPWEEHVPLDFETRDRFPIIYYQWVPLSLLVQAMFFYIPILVWRMFNNRTGIDVNDIVETSEKIERAEDEKMRDQWISFVTNQLHRYLRTSKTGKKAKQPGAHPGPPRRAGKMAISKFGNRMTIMFIFIKVLFLANIVGQLFVLNWFLGHNFNMYGIKLIQFWMSGDTMDDSPYFPRVTFCDVEVRRLGNLHRYTVQCVLPINMFNEKIYAFLWFWFFLLGVITTFSLLQWIVRILIPNDSSVYVKSLLSSAHERRKRDPNYKLRDVELFGDQTTRDRCKVFVNTYLRADGVLVLRLIDCNTNKVSAEDVTTAVFRKFEDANYPKDAKNAENDAMKETNIDDVDSMQPFLSGSSGSNDDMTKPSAPEEMHA